MTPMDLLLELAANRSGGIGIKCLEAEVILEGLKAYGCADNFEGKRRKLPLVVESDSIEVVGALNHDCEDLTELSLILDEIEYTGKFSKVIGVSKCSIKENLLAHNLTRATAANRSVGFFGSSRLSVEEDEEFWREDVFPYWFTSILIEDINVLNCSF